MDFDEIMNLSIKTHLRIYLKAFIFLTIFALKIPHSQDEKQF